MRRTCKNHKERIRAWGDSAGLGPIHLGSARGAMHMPFMNHSTTDWRPYILKGWQIICYFHVQCEPFMLLWVLPKATLLLKSAAAQAEVKNKINVVYKRRIVELHHFPVYTFSGFIVHSCCRVKKNIHIDLSCLQLSLRWIRCSVRNERGCCCSLDSKD